MMQAAAHNSEPKIITILVEAGADINARDKSGKTAFDYAKDNKHIKGSKAYKKLKDASISSQ
ncbi:MAG: ankyrin repeat domain-containing protein [Candidatus Rifleibacteriota bacterium]